MQEKSYDLIVIVPVVELELSSPPLSVSTDQIKTCEEGRLNASPIQSYSRPACLPCIMCPPLLFLGPSASPLLPRPGIFLCLPSAFTVLIGFD